MGIGQDRPESTKTRAPERDLRLHLKYACAGEREPTNTRAPGINIILKEGDPV